MDKGPQHRNRLSILLLLFASIIASVSLSAKPVYSQNPNPAQGMGSCQSPVSFPGSCTTFLAKVGDTVLFGNNEDYDNPNTYIWIEPSSSVGYAGLYFGYSADRPQGGMNEKGLAFDALALPPTSLNPHPELMSKGSSDTKFIAKFMSQCATVEEVIELSQEYNWGESIGFQVLFADQTGDAVIISGGSDGELAYTRKPPGDGYLIGTNFNRANPENHAGQYPCWRYDTVDSQLSQIDNESDLSVDQALAILEEVHIEGLNENTLYSNVFDLRRGELHLVYWHQYGEVITLNVSETIAAGLPLPLTRIRDLFSTETVGQAEAEIQGFIKQAERNDWLNQYGKVIIGGGGVLVIITVVGSIVLIRKRRSKG